MSRAGVGMVIEKLLSDESLRSRFAVDRMETIAELLFTRLRAHTRRDRPLLPDRCSSVVPERDKAMSICIDSSM